MDGAAKKSDDTAAGDRSAWPFAKLLDWHLDNGTRPDGSPALPGRRWGNKTFAAAVGGVHERTVRNWRNGHSRPTDLESIERELFGENPAFGAWRRELRRAFDGTADDESRDRADHPENATAPTIDRPARCFGREDETAELVAALLGEPVAALVLGGAGMGKTTLTLEASTHPDVMARYHQRRWFVPLETATDAAAFDSALVKALGHDPATTRFERALTTLAGAPALVVLDNLETPWEADRLAVEASLKRLRAVEGAAILASIRGGDAPAGLRWNPRITVAPLSEADARDLFRDIAPNIALDDQHLPPLLTELGGVPLAIELVALQATPFARLDDLWAEWQRRGSALAERSGVERSRLSSLDRSLELSLGSRRIAKAGRRLFALLGQLPAGVAPADRDSILGEAGFTAAAELLSAGLARSRDGSRLDLLPPVRDYARRHHQPTGDGEALWWTYYLGLARDLGSRIWFADGIGVVGRLAPELANMEAAIGAALVKCGLAEAVSAIDGVFRLLASTGLGSPTTIRSVAEACHSASNALGEAVCLEHLGDLALRRSKHNAAKDAYDRALVLHRQIGNVLGEANCLHGIGHIAFEHDDRAAARELYDAALSLYREIGAVIGQANCTWRLGDIALADANYETARTAYETAAPLFGSVGDTLGEAICIVRFGDIAARRSDHDAAHSAYETAMPLFQRVGNSLGEANCMVGLGDVALARDDPDTARKAYEEALPIFRQVGHVLGEANCIRSIGNIALDRSDHDAAREAYEKALPLYREIGSFIGEANCIASLGGIAMARSDHDTARAAFKQALGIYERTHELYGVGWTRVRLARLAKGRERTEHLSAARVAWTSIQRPDLLAHLDEFERELSAR